MDQDHTNTPQSNAQRNERAEHALDSPKQRRTPQVPLLPPLPQPFQLPTAPSVGPLQFRDPFQANYAPAPVYQHLPAHLAQAVAQLPKLLPVHGRHRGHHMQNQIYPVPQLPPVSL